MAGRINGRFGTTAVAPIHVINRSLSQQEVAALYKAADVMLVTPMRDGMNLVAKEFVASRHNEDRVLVLSEFAGAAEELKEALLVNPYDTEDMAAKIRQALEIGKREQRSRMRALRTRVMSSDVGRWIESFLISLEAAAADRKLE